MLASSVRVPLAELAISNGLFPGLAGVELEAIRAYESAGRARKTILNRVAQLQGTNGAG